MLHQPRQGLLSNITAIIDYTHILSSLCWEQEDNNTWILGCHRSWLSINANKFPSSCFSVQMRGRSILVVHQSFEVHYLRHTSLEATTLTVMCHLCQVGQGKLECGVAFHTFVHMGHDLHDLRSLHTDNATKTFTLRYALERVPGALKLEGLQAFNCIHAPFATRMFAGFWPIVSLCTDKGASLSCLCPTSKAHA